MKNNQKGFTTPELFFVIFWLIGLIGYAWNIVRLINSWEDWAVIGIIEVVRIIGLFMVPLGIIMGYIPA